MEIKQQSFGLYLHIPFCDRVCHYCDFAKTSAFSRTKQQSYLTHLATHVKHWLHHLPEPRAISSVFFGGGTPGLFTSELEPIIEAYRPFLAEHAEQTIEVNPENVNEESCATWKNLGINRISMGVQSFSSKGLKTLTRGHEPTIALSAVDELQRHFTNFNIDLIYGWHHQTRDEWLEDLEIAILRNIPHLSLYALTYEGNTPFARRIQRDLWKEPPESLMESLYADACSRLKESGYLHEEVSNWSKPGYHCEHNWIYWKGDHYAGIGTGAHGFIPSAVPQGVRYAYPSQPVAFYQMECSADVFLLNDSKFWTGSFDVRNMDDWLLEKIATGARTIMGIDVKRLCEIHQKQWHPTPTVQMGLSDGLLKMDANMLFVTEHEWFREQRWALEIFASFSNN